MKIGIVCYPSHGGSGVIATELGMELAARGHTVHFISYQMPFRLNLFRAGVHYHEVDMPSYPLFKFPPYTLALINKIAGLAESEGLEIIHAHYAVPHSFCAHMSREIMGSSGVKVVTTLHGTDITLVGSDPSFHRITAYSMEKSDGITAVSHYLAQQTRKTFDIKKEINVIYNFVDTDKFSPDIGAKEKLDCLPDGYKVLMHVSNFRPVKRVTDVIKIFSGIRRKMPVKLLMVGDGVHMPLAREKARELKVEEDVLFLGIQDNILPLLSAADLFLLPSEKESFGLGALEAMACGVPVISSNAGGLPEVVAHGETGFTAPVGDIKSMVAYALELLQEDALLQSMRAAARLRAEDFAKEKIIPQYEEFYRRTLAK